MHQKRFNNPSFAKTNKKGLKRLNSALVRFYAAIHTLRRIDRHLDEREKATDRAYKMGGYRE